MRPTSNEALAELLREHPPRPDDLARARMEKSIVERPSAPQKKKRPLAWIAVGALAAAAILALVLLGREEETTRVARFERRPASAAVSRGTLDEGSTLATEANEVAELRIDASRVRIAGASRARVAELSSDRIGLELDAGSLWIAFHPHERGRERMTIETPDARVEVVGTVFRVTVREGVTEVSVREGIVRVVPNSGAPRLVRAGEQMRTAPFSRPAPAVNEPAPVQTQAVREEPRDDPAERLQTAQRLLRQRRTAQGLAVLRALTPPSVAAPIRSEAWSLIADTQEREGNYEEAARAYGQVARIGRRSDAHAAIFALARMQERRLHDAQAARASYQRYLREAPNGPLAAQSRSALCRLGDSEQCGSDP